MYASVLSVCLASLAPGATHPSRAGTACPDFELRANRQEIALARSGPRKAAQLRVAIGRLEPGRNLPIRLSLAPPNTSGQREFDVRLDRSQATLGGGASAQTVVTVSVQTRENAREGSDTVYVLTAASPTGARELRFRVFVDEHDPQLGMGMDGAGNLERTHAFARGGRVGTRLRLSNDGVIPGIFEVAAAAPPGWVASFPDGIVTTRYVGAEAVALDLAIEASEAVPAGSLATVRVQATSLRTREVDEIELTVENGGHLYVASATGVPRAHLVPAGGETTWVARLFPYADGPRRVSLALTGASPGWTGTLSTSEVVVDPTSGPVEVTAVVRAPANVPDGTPAEFALGASTDRGEQLAERLLAQVTSLPRVYIVAVDSLNEEYLHLDHTGRRAGAAGDWLMPRAHGLMERGTSYANGRSDLPSSTDMNHTNIICGTMTGTTGVPMVNRFFTGEDRVGNPVAVNGTHEMLRSGADGTPVTTMFEGIRTAEPLARGAIVSGKGWVNNLLEDGGRTVQISAAGDRGPDYIGRPEQYVLGDPASDADAADDPPARWLVYAGQSIGQVLGLVPTTTPSDAFIMNSTLRIIANEDPEVVYVILGNMDYGQHSMGNATNLGEWDERGTACTWDDVNRVNDLASREEVLDIAREADHQLGRLLDFLEERGRLDGSIVVLTADHGQVTHPPTAITFDAELRQAGISPATLAAYGGTSVLTLYDLSPPQAAAVERVLERRTIVYNRDEMRTGIDTATGKAWARPRELYSEFWAAQDFATDGTFRWPSLFAFAPGNEQFALDSPYFQRHRGTKDTTDARVVGGHGGPATQHVPVVLAGPGIPQGVVQSAIVSSNQIVPTIYGLLQIPSPSSVDAPPLVGLDPGLTAAGSGRGVTP